MAGNGAHSPADRFVTWYNALHDSERAAFAAQVIDPAGGESPEHFAMIDWINTVSDVTMADYDKVSELWSAGIVEVGDDGIARNRP